MQPLITLLLIILFSIIVNKIATAALVRTGLSRKVASFQAQSAFSGVGFTTSESEYVVSHPVRRKIIRILMLLGSAGLTSAVATLVLSFVGQTARGAAIRLAVLAIGLAVLYVFATSKTIDRVLGRIIEWGLDRFTTIRPVDYESLLGVARGYIVSTFRVTPDSWLAGKTLRQAGLREEGIVVLGIYRRVNGRVVYLGAPKPDTRILPGDELVVYGPEEAIANLVKRHKGVKGDMEHERMIARQKRREAEEAALAL
ncbi:MAG: TrkA C-terminal domain-containing protein [Desulfurococcales archaeon]|nr:TrkA C-terminal domain-containing protein [Desulfurococcales archaeon]